LAVGTYLQRPNQFLAAAWDGTNATDINTVMQSVGWSFTADNGGTAHSPFGYSVPVSTGTWVVAGGGGPQFLTTEQFMGQFVAGSTWAVAP